MLLTCPNCRSGLQVPDGTAAMVRCPACKTVFSPADDVPNEEVDEETEGEEEPPKAKPRPTRPKGEEEKPRNRDFDPVTEEEDRERRRRRRAPPDEALSPREKAARRAAFKRAAVGARLIWVSFSLFMLSMVLILIYFFQSAFADPVPLFITIAGVIGLLNWVLAAVGVGLCLSGPPSPGHYGYGIAAAVAVFVHFLFLLALVAQGKEVAVGKTEDGSPNARWGLIPTRLNATMFYLSAVVYPDDDGLTPRGPMRLSMVTGVAEMVRTVLVMMLLSCLARSALDEELAHRCTRAAGVASFGPGLLAVLFLVFVAAMVETRAGGGTLGQVLLATVNMGVYAVVIGTMFPALAAARDVDDACEEPFQSLIPQM